MISFGKEKVPAGPTPSSLNVGDSPADIDGGCLSSVNFDDLTSSDPTFAVSMASRKADHHTESIASPLVTPMNTTSPALWTPGLPGSPQVYKV
jgi:hypothetical protein